MQILVWQIVYLLWSLQFLYLSFLILRYQYAFYNLNLIQIASQCWACCQSWYLIVLFYVVLPTVVNPRIIFVGDGPPFRPFKAFMRFLYVVFSVFQGISCLGSVNAMIVSWNTWFISWLLANILNSRNGSLCYLCCICNYLR